jgi:hypothetical protein
MAALTGVFGCSAAPADTDVAVCAGYPDGAVEPMAVGSVLFPYAWPDARRLDRNERLPLSLGEAPCNTDPDIEWSPFDVLLFVSLPAW